MRRPSRAEFAAEVLVRWPAARPRDAYRGVMVALDEALEADRVAEFARSYGLHASVVPGEVRVFNFPRSRRSS